MEDSASHTHNNHPSSVYYQLIGVSSLVELFWQQNTNYHVGACLKQRWVRSTFTSVPQWCNQIYRKWNWSPSCPRTRNVPRAKPVRRALSWLTSIPTEKHHFSLHKQTCRDNCISSCLLTIIQSAVVAICVDWDPLWLSCPSSTYIWPYNYNSISSS